MATDQMAYDALQTAMARQRVTVYDLYGLLDVSPNVDEAGIRRAYDRLSRKLRPDAPKNVVNIAYSILVNPFKRAQYDRDRLEYLYTHFNAHESFLAPSRLSTPSLASRDEQIQVYATTLVDRVKDPVEEKKTAINHRITTIRNELDEFNELSFKQRQNWATSSNRVLRMAGNALCEVVVCAEEDLRMLEDELGRVDGTLEPRDKDGPAGRVTSGQYGSEISALNVYKAKPSVLMGQRIPSIPRSPTVALRPMSASKLGIQGQDISGKNEGDTPSTEGSASGTRVRGSDRVQEYLLNRTYTLPAPQETTAKHQQQQQHQYHRHMPSLRELYTNTNIQANVDTDSPSTVVRSPMGLVEYQRIHGLYHIDEDSEHDSAASELQDAHHHISVSAEGLHMNQQPSVPDFSKPWRNSWDPAYVQSIPAPEGSFGFHVTQPAARGSATASNIALFKESQDRAAAAARAPGRWVVGGPGLTNYDEDSWGQEKYVQEKFVRKKRDANDPFA